VDEKESNVILTVRDTGVGIPEDELPYIFERFHQVDNSATRQGEGTGIGLTLVSELIKVMKGSIKVISKVGKGSTFTISLPMTNDADMIKDSNWTSESSADMIAAGLPSNVAVCIDEDSNVDLPHILLVEDNVDVIQYLITCLKESFRIEIALNGEEGIEKAQESIPDIIVSDVMMPIKDGYELCDTLKTDERTSHIPIILLTAKADIEARLTGLQRGADAYLNKPFDEEELLLILKNMLAVRQRLQLRFSKVYDPQFSAERDSQSTEDHQSQKHLQIEDEFLQKIQGIIEKDLSNHDIGMTQLVRGLSMSRSQIYKKVKALSGVAPSQYLRSIRLYHAKRLLESTDLNVSEVAYKVGFSSPSYFSTAFLDEFGYSPNEA